tara:strand:+ start:2746 stop:3081 length:336 start_codon:yes stop_codon:yes gene_type:complete
MYKYRKTKKSQLTSVELLEGETLEQKIERIVDNGEPITDGAPEIYTERKQGVLSAYNIRTDRWEVACEGMDIVSKSMNAKRDNKPTTEKEGKVVKLEVKDSGAESTDAKAK